MSSRRFTLEALDAASSPMEAWTQKQAELVEAFSYEQWEKFDGRETSIEPEHVVSRKGLEDLVASLGLQGDAEVVELNVLAALQMESAVTRHTGPTLMLAAAIAERSVQLLESRPELAHPNLQVPRWLARFGHRSLLTHMLVGRVMLEPDRLEKAVRVQPVLGELIKRTLLKLEEASPFNEMTVSGGRPKLLRALVRVVPELVPMFATGDNLTKLAALAALNSTVLRDHQDMLGLLDELLACQARSGDQAKFRWGARGTDILETIGLSWASARVSHPMLAFFYEAALDSAQLTSKRRLRMRTEQAPGFPEVPLTALAQRLDALMAPEDRIPLASIPAVGLLELVALSPVAAQNARVIGFWHEVDQGTQELPPSSLVDVLDWAVNRVDGQGRQVMVADVDSKLDLYRRSIGNAATNRIYATLIERAMSQALDESPAAQPAGPAPTSSSLPAMGAQRAARRI